MKAAKRFLSMLLTLCMLLSLLPSTVFAANSNVPFTDVKETDWFYDAVGYAYENGMMSGTGNNQFSPNVTTTRGMIVTILYRLEGSPAVSTAFFDDVAAGEYYTNGVSWAAANGIVSGYGNGQFGPNDPITREQMAAILYRYAQHKEYETTVSGDVSSFTDGASVSSYAVEPMNWAVGTGLLSGVGNNMLNPTGNATRAEAATILTRYCKGFEVQLPGEDTSLGGEPTCTVTFAYNYGNKGTYETAEVNVGETVDKPSNPSRSGYSFAGWYTKAMGGEKFDFEEAVAEDMTLYAHWNIISSGGSTLDPEPNPDDMVHTVSFDTNCNNVIASPESQTIRHGEYAVVPSIATRNGYQFAGWFLNKDETDWTNVFSFGETPIVDDITLYAIWVDIITDTDGDGLSDELELYIKTNVNITDTDGDGLTDYQEVVIVGTDPLLFDTDNDGISDFDADIDFDGLTNGFEVSIGTNPNNSDSDNDGLTDSEELNIYATDPINPDTDSDGALDGWEIEHGFDPCVYNDSFQVSIAAQIPTETNPVTAGVDAELNGSGASSLTVKPIGASSNPLLSASIPGYLGSAYDFEIDGDLYEAVLNFSFDESIGTIGPDFQPRIYYFNEETGTLEELENQTVAEGKISVPVSHFSTYILLNKVEFDKVWESEIKPPVFNGEEDGKDASLDIVFVIDYSASMDDNDPNQLFKELSKEFISKLRKDQDQAAVVKFIRRATLISALTSDKDALNSAINSISYDSGYSTDSGTDGSTGIRLAIDQLIGSESEYQYIIFVTDGEDNQYTYSYDALIEEAAANNIVIYTIGMGSASESILKEIANGTDGKYYHATTDDVSTDDILDLGDVFEEIESETIDLTTDSNNDGIPDYFNDLICAGTLVLSNGSDEFYGIDFNYDANDNPSDDWDGDGLKNGEELIVTYNEETGRVYMTMVSDPMMVHSDGDAISDYDEVKNGTDPLKVQYDDYYMEWLADNSHYYYEDYVSMYDDSTLYQLDSAFLAVVFGLWNVEELYRDILADYFLDYVDTLEGESEKEERAIFVDIADDFLGTLSDINGVISDVRYYKGFVKGVKNLISVANGYSTSIEAISVEYVKMVQEVSTYYPDAGLVVTSTHSMSSTSVSVLTKNSPLKTGSISGVSIAFNVLGGAIDMADTITTLAAVNANAKIFDENMDYLVELRDNGSRQYMIDAAAKIINTLGEGYGTAMAEALAQDTGELTANILITVASANPYVKAVKFLRDVIAHVTGIKESLKIEYQMLAYNCMSYSAKNLISKDSYYSNGYYYSFSDNLGRYLTHLAQVRILGEKKYDSFYSTGANKWFNDEDEIHEWILTSIDNIEYCAQVLDLKISDNLS